MASGSPKILDEGELRNISRNLGSVVPKASNNAAWTYESTPEHLLSCLFFTVNQADITTKHRTAACDALGGFLEHGLKSISNVQEVCLQPSTWEAALVAYLEHSEDTVKPMKQLLATLVRTLCKRDDENAIVIAHDAASRCLHYIYSREDISSVKPAMLALETLLNKGRISPERVVLQSLPYSPRPIALEGYNVDSVPISLPEVAVADFVYSVLTWAHYAHVAPATSKLLSSFFKALQGRDIITRSTNSSLPLWITPVQTIIAENDDMLEVLERQVIPDLLQVDYGGIFKSSGGSQLLQTLQVDRLLQNDVGSVPEKDVKFCLLVLGCMGSSGDSIQPQILELFFTLLSHASSEVSVHALFLIFPATRALSSAISSEHLRALLYKLPSFHLETDARARNEFISIVKKMLASIDISLARSPKPMGGLEQVHNQLHSHTSLDPVLFPDPSLRLMGFTVRYLDFLYNQLQPVASYQRHFTGLRAIKHAFSTGLINTSKIDLQTPFMLQALINLVMDAFDDVRASAAMLLKQFPSDVIMRALKPTKPSNLHTQSIIGRAEKMMQQTGRADYADGVGRLYDLSFESCLSNSDTEIRKSGPIQIIEYFMSSLEHEIGIAASNLSLAVSNAPIHGRFIALRYVMGRPDSFKAIPTGAEWRKFHNRIMATFLKVWEIVRPVLCIDSPEGHGEGDDDDEIEIGVKDTLSYSWRTLKEASSLMQALLNNERYGRYKNLCLLSFEDYKAMGDLSFSQLAELRHRGAFSTVSQTFASCCIQCVRSDDSRTNSLPEHWFKETLKCIQAKASALTRRSAGLPAMICGVLAPYPSGQFFEDVLMELKLTATKKTEETEMLSGRIPQVHALNCIKDVFTNSRLASGADRHLSGVIEIAVGCLEHKIWAITNCGIMLFKALMNRLTGGSGSNTLATGTWHRRFPKVVFQRYPRLEEILIHQLERSCELQGQSLDEASRVLQMQVGFPAMEIIERVGVPPSRTEDIKKCLLVLLESSVWNIREKAAKTLSTFSSIDVLLSNISSDLCLMSPSDNKLHGLLLSLADVIQNVNWLKKDNLAQTVDTILSLFETLVINPSNPFLSGAYLKVLSLLLKSLDSPRYSRDRISDSRPLQGISNQYLVDIQFEKAIEVVGHNLLRLATSPPKHSPHSYFSESRAYLEAQYASITSWKGDFLLLSTYSVVDYAKQSSSWSASLLALQHFPPNSEIPHLKLLLENYYSSLSAGQLHIGSQAMGLDYLTQCITRCRNLTLTDPEDSDLHRVRDSISSILQHHRFLHFTEPSTESSLLKFQGALIAFMMESASTELPHEWLRKEQLSTWGTRLMFSLDERCELPLRIAAAVSIESFRTVLRPPSSSKPSQSIEFIPVYLALYTALLDDDNEVRDPAALAVSWLLSKPAASKSINPYIAAESLLDIFSDDLASDPSIYTEALFRLTGSTTWHQSQAKELFEVSMRDNTALFAEEKQNLYVDPVQEAERWAKVLCKLPSRIRPERLFKQTTVWVKEGIDAILKTSRMQVDGALGWSSKADTFILGSRVLAATDVVLSWATEDSLAEGKETVEELKEMLDELAVQGEKSMLNGHWMVKIKALTSKAHG